MTPSLTRWPGCALLRSRAGARCTTLPWTSLSGGCGSMSETGAGRPAWAGDSGRGSGGDEAAREAKLARAFVRVAGTLGSEFGVCGFLHGLAADSVEILRAAAAGVMLADARGGLRLIASSDERMRLLELFELQGEQGPGLDAYSSGRAGRARADDSRA